MSISSHMKPASRSSPSKSGTQTNLDSNYEIQPMPKHVFLNTLPGNLAPFPQISRSKFQNGENIEYFGQESLFNNFIAKHCADFKMPSQINKGFKRKAAIVTNAKVKDTTRDGVVATEVIEEAEDDEEEVTEQLAPAAAAVTKSVRGRHQCSFCQRIFSNGSNLKTHMRLHTGAKPYKCRYCEKTSATQSNIMTHERTHTGVRPFTCDICNNEYSTSSNLKTHRRTHFNIRPFQCRMCGKGFCSSSNLITHLRAHWGLRLYPCTTCGKQFSTSSNLSVHVRITHLAQRPFICAICGKDFSTGGNLVAHLRSHPEGMPSQLPPPEPELTSASDLGYITMTTPEALKSANAGLLKPEFGADSNMLVPPNPTKAGPQSLNCPLSPPMPHSEKERKFARISVYHPTLVPVLQTPALSDPSSTVASATTFPQYSPAPTISAGGTSWDFGKFDDPGVDDYGASDLFDKVNIGDTKKEALL